MGLEDITKDERNVYRVQTANNCALVVLYNSMVKTATSEKDTKLYSTSKKVKEQNAAWGQLQSIIDIDIPATLLKSADFRFYIKQRALDYALLKTREHYWSNYSDFKQLEYWRTTPKQYRRDKYTDGINIPEMTTDIAVLLINHIALWLKIVYSQKYRVRKDKWGRLWRSQGRPSKELQEADNKIIRTLQNLHNYYLY